MRVDVAEIPFVRLRQVLGGEAVPGFDAATAQAQQALAALPVPGPLVVDLPQRCLHLGPHRVALPPLQLVLYAQLACLRQRGAGEDGLVLLEELEACREEMLQRYAALYGPHSGHVARLRRQWQHGLPRDTVRTHFAVINRRLRQAVLAPAELYTIASRRQYGRTRYGLRLPPAAIHLREN
ncbi:MAG: hypothetical protein KatS3mg131_2247 [Candidatus Tectimicrobiota bacterium]|nr:MAG: hypothetical protein KatS3mg131_2247 [Candidatus Tectomicrobia bacterium]